MKPLVAIEIPLALAAIVCGLLLVVAPDGALIGLPPALLVGSPFPDYLVPGLTLAFVVGGAVALAGVLALTQHRLAGVASWAAAFVLAIWLAVQVRYIPFHPMQAVIAAATIAIAIGASRTRARPA